MHTPLTRALATLSFAGMAWLSGSAPAHAQSDNPNPDEVTPATGVTNNEHAVDLLVQRLTSSESYKVRAQAAVLLGRMGGTTAVPALISALDQDEHYVVRAACATALGVIGDDRAVEGLFNAVSDGELIIREASARALVRMDARRNFDTLVRFAREGNPEQRRVAVTRLADLARVGDDAATEVLVRALGDETAIKDASSHGLADLPSDRAMPILVKALGSDDMGVRAEAARLLGARKEPRAVEALAAAYERVGEQEKVRVEIRRSLERLRPVVNLTDLIQQARANPNKEARVRAIRLLGVVGDPRTAAAVEELLKDSDPYIQGSAALALADQGSVQSIPRLEETLVHVENTRAEAPVSNALKKLRRLKDQPER